MQCVLERTLLLRIIHHWLGRVWSPYAKLAGSAPGHGTYKNLLDMVSARGKDGMSALNGNGKNTVKITF